MLGFHPAEWTWLLHSPSPIDQPSDGVLETTTGNAQARIDLFPRDSVDVAIDSRDFIAFLNDFTAGC